MEEQFFNSSAVFVTVSGQTSETETISHKVKPGPVFRRLKTGKASFKKINSSPTAFFMALNKKNRRSIERSSQTNQSENNNIPETNEKNIISPKAVSD
ncbi:Uncharacterized protein dnl_62490 [Desulfonema limicola]|uniref:Uncharacterized protein n=1 Tax=Desulfonema limicola TaxID=45656 RepID=A0A975GJL4_9BACT|nr:Uncharacterized protein dnl_62490 [Desulfonema limicola]